MKEKWKKIYFLLLWIFCFILTPLTTVEALNIYNGVDVPAGGGGGKCEEGQQYNHFCRHSMRPGTRISVVYYDGSTYQTIGKSIDFYSKSSTFFSSSIRYNSQTSNNKVSIKNPAPNQAVAGTYPVNSGYFNLSYFKPASAGGYTYVVKEGMPVSGSGERNYWSDLFLKKSLDNDGNIKEDSEANQIIKLCTEHSLNDKSFWSKYTELADPTGGGFNKKGYRILIEPIYIYVGKDNNGYVMSTTEYASLVWNTGSYTTLSQVSFYVRESERMVTEFDDIGIRTTASCSSLACTAQDVQFTGPGGKGHALHIIDFSKLIKNDCDYETGAGFPVGKGTGAELTEQEKKCCEQKIKEIQKEHELTNTRQVVCMTTSATIPEYISCINDYFKNMLLEEEAIKAEQQDLKELQEKYPACLNCDYEKMETIESNYRTCLNGMSITTWMARFLAGQDTSCEINRRSAIATYKNNYPLCPPQDDCPWYECPDPLPSGCNENNPNHFPESGSTNPDKTCCVYFENQMKIQYEKEAKEKGLKTEAAIRNYISGKINSWFNERGKEFRLNCLSTQCDINDTNLTEACCKELMEKYPSYSNSYWIGKGCGIDTEDNCRWTDYKVSGIEHVSEGNCSGSTSVNVKDSTNWECIFESDNIQNGTIVDVFKDYYLKYSNPYCAVYCREEVTYNFPTNSMTVKAGNHFTVGSARYSPNWSPIQFTSTRECKTSGSTNDNNSTEINTEKFEDDWERANEKVMSTWDEWKIAQQKEWAYEHYDESDEFDCDPRVVRYREEVFNYEEVDGEWIRVGPYYELRTKIEYLGHWRYPYRVHYDGVNVTPNPWCSTEWHPDPNSDYKAWLHEKAKQELMAIEDDILACTSWNNFNSYRNVSVNNTNIKATRYSKYASYQDFLEYDEFSPDLTISYDEPTNNSYDYTDLLDKFVSSTNVSNNFSTTGAVLRKYNCPSTRAPYHEPCSTTNRFYYSPQKETHATYTKNINYKLKEGVFNVVLKPQGTAVHGSEKGSDSEQIYVDLGYSALHTHFMTPTGNYDISLSYPGYTPTNNVSGREHNFDQFIEETPNYECTYRVHNEIIENEDDDCVDDNCTACTSGNCSPEDLKGLNLIYRPISLTNPFPGVEGDGRTPGSNWNNSTYISKYITNNRGVSANRIYYDKYPMYQITLTPALIQEIRKYNEGTNYNDFNMDCLESGKECKSKFIRGNLEGGYNFSNHFRSCQQSGVGGSVTCCGIGNWNDCDNQDRIVR